MGRHCKTCDPDRSVAKKDNIDIIRTAHFLKIQHESVFTGLGEYKCICEERSTKSFVAPDEAAWNLINSLLIQRYHSVVQLHCGICWTHYGQFKNK